MGLGIGVVDLDLTVTDSIIIGNLTNAVGGGIFTGGPVTVTNSTGVGNAATGGSGGGISARSLAKRAAGSASF